MNPQPRASTPASKPVHRTKPQHSAAGLHRKQSDTLPPPLAGAPLGQDEIVLVLAAKRGFIGGVLRQLGYRVLEAVHTAEAQSLAQSEQNVRLLLMDLSVMDTRHLEFALWFRTVYPETKVLV